MTAADLVEVESLRVMAGATTIVDGVSFSVAPGEVVALIGESGSGKTTTALALLGYARAGCRIVGGRVRVGSTEVLALDRRGLARLRGRQVAYIAQSAAAAFNPAKPILAQVIEAARIHRLMPRAAAEAKAVALFRSLALPDPEGIGARYPHQVSGGQLQRLLAAMALITDPALVVFDEPTTALDVTTQIEVLRAFKSVVRERRTTGVYVSHDLAVVAQMADRIVVLRDGRMRETGATAALLAAPGDDYTRRLVAAAHPEPRPAPAMPPAEAPLLAVRGLVAGYGPAVTVLHQVDLTIRAGSALGVIGESGCGKSTLARVIAGLLPRSAGTIELDGAPLAPAVARRSRESLRRVQIVFQMADTALNPAATVGAILARPLAFYFRMPAAARRRRVQELLDLVQLPAGVAERRPAELSGGQKQRVNLARAFAARPSLVLCDEVTSALDTVVGAAILDLMAELRRELGVSYLFISHDLSTVQAICDEVMVLYAGHTVEAGSRGAIGQAPRHPYADLLIGSIPELRTGWLDSVAERPSLPVAGSAAGCSFFARCPVRVAGTCDAVAPPARTLAKGATIWCHRSEAELLAIAGADQAGGRPALVVGGLAPVDAPLSARKSTA